VVNAKKFVIISYCKADIEYYNVMLSVFSSILNVLYVRNHLTFQIIAFCAVQMTRLYFLTEIGAIP